MSIEISSLSMKKKEFPILRNHLTLLEYDKEIDDEEYYKQLGTNWDKFSSKFYHQSLVQNRKFNVFKYIPEQFCSTSALTAMAKSTRPFLAKELYERLGSFMTFMKGLPGIEGQKYQSIYDSMTPEMFIKRLLVKRPIVFLTSDDIYVLRDDMNISSGRHDYKWKSLTVTADPDPRFNLKEYISYDEMLVSALINVSTPTLFLNGIEKKISPNAQLFGNHEPFGIFCGLVGARLEKGGYMEHRLLYPKDRFEHHCHKSDEFWIKSIYSDAFPEGKIPTSDEIKNNSIYGTIYCDNINVIFLRKRLLLSAIPFLIESNNRGVEGNVNVASWVAPIGMGVWAGDIDNETYRKTFAAAILNHLDETYVWENYSHIKVIFMPQISSNSVYKNFIAKGRIGRVSVIKHDRIEIEFRNPPYQKIVIINRDHHLPLKLDSEFEACLFVASYAWDSNSYPGNEYWIGGHGSFDPIAVLQSLLGQFQNPEVNVNFTKAERIRTY